MDERTGNLDAASVGESSLEELSSAGARVMREIIRTPAFREIVKLNLAESDPRSAQELVRVLLSEDLNFSMGLMAKSPALINALTEAAIELGRQAGRFPPGMLESVLPQILEEIDADRFAQIPKVYGPLLEEVLASNPQMREKALEGVMRGANGVIRAALGFLRNLDTDGTRAPRAPKTPLDAQALGEAVTLSARLVSRSMRENPAFWRELLSNVDFGDVLRAAIGLLGSAVRSALGRTGALIKGLWVKQNKRPQR